MVEMSVDSVRIGNENNQRVVILKDQNDERYLCIWIANPEAYSIAMELQGSTPPRPLTHDLLKTVIVELGAKVERIVINDLIDDIFYARIVMDVDGRHVEIDSRSSDAIALAVRLKAPIFVADKVMDAASVPLTSGGDETDPGAPETRAPAYNLDVYRDFIQGLDSLDELDK
ncbi:MAG: bifunctional nuclease family protein [Chloroflexota bacterium]|nr:bifunctional nuclease family protein [Chloroflexota bacterium]